MTGHEPGRLARLVTTALDKAGVRGILATGWGGLAGGPLPDTIFRMDQAPHDRLFPRMAAVIHHGGAGTTAAGLAAGRPSVVVPFFGHQPFWGQRIHDLEAGPAPIPRKKLSADNLARAIRQAVRSPGILKTAKDLGEKIRKEDGIKTAIEVIEHVMKKGET